MNTSLNKQRGFTIIEVVLVLAIAALIFLMIFVALPALQRGQRDTARKEDVGTIAAAVNSYKSNNSGQVPKAADDDEFMKYIDKLSQIDTGSITISSDNSGDGPTELDHVIIYPGGKCKDDNTAEAGSSRQAAVVTVMEAGKNNVKYCQGV